MEDFLHALHEDLLKEMECPVCTEYMVPPITLCKNGHNICSKCRERVQCCPTCRATFSEIRNVALENIARKLKCPCSNRQNGCLELFPIEHIAKHHADCVYGKIKCPFHLLKMCSWNGFKNGLKEHAIAAHPGWFWENSTFLFPLLSDYLVIASYFGELFTFYKQKKDGRYYAAVQLIGTSSEASKYKYELTLRAANGIEKISNTFLVQGYSEDFGTTFNSGMCLCLDEKTVKHFVEGNELNMTATLSTVK